MKTHIFAFLVFLFLLFANPIYAVVDPLAFTNNKYGIHVIDENDLYDAAKLVNSSGGDWGYVTMVITYDDRKLEKWQRTFDLLKNWHLIPIIRLATRLSNDTWEKPKNDQAKDWSNFLEKLHWPIKNRYVVLFNEPNHAKEWGNDVNPREYADIAVEFSKEFRNTSSDFFILPAGLDASAPNSSQTMDELKFLSIILSDYPNYLSYFDGWTSHSYPNPGFRGKVSDLGRGTLRTYLWEMEVLKSLNQRSNFPIFITETGWPHKEGSLINYSYYSAVDINNHIIEAANIVWRDPQIVALTPFLLNYGTYPFSNFSWKKEGQNAFYPYYYSYQNIPKNSGSPQFSYVFEKFEGLKLENLSRKDNSNLKGTLDWLSLKVNLRSLFYRWFKL